MVTSWEAHSSVLIKIHKVLILSKLDYGSSLFSLVNQFHQKKLKTLHNSGIQPPTGTFRSSPIDSIWIIAGAEQKSLLATRIYRTPQEISTSHKNKFQDLQDIFDLDQVILSVIRIQPPFYISLDIHLTNPTTSNNKR